MQAQVTRRQFLKLSGAMAATLAVLELGFNDLQAHADSKEFKIAELKPTPTICPFCGVGCGILVYSKNDTVVYTEGDPDHPINEGTLCSKGTTIREIYTSSKRVEKPRYRAPGSDKWVEKDWDWMLDKIAERAKETRDKTFTHKKDGMIVNKTEAIACMGGAALDNEETYLLSKLMRAGMGLTWIEHQARICHSSTVPGLASSFGRGAMTNHWNDIQYADAVLIMGSNPAENHPISFRWILKAKEKGAKVLSVDPRYTRTSVQSDHYAPLRSGTDIAFLGGMIKYIFDNELYFKEYVANYTNASFILNDDYKFEDGLFSGYDADTYSYDRTSWGFAKDENDKVIKDMTLQHPRSVFQLMKKHYSRYTVDVVTGITGTPKDQYMDIVKAFTATGVKDKAGTILYAMGTTQHTVGVENVRAFAVVQLLLGNIGIAGGGINAMRGESNVQGSTDFGLLYHNTTGYMEVPTSAPTDVTFESFLTRITPKAGVWTNKPKFYTSLMKAYYGDKATKSNEFGYNFLPKLTPKKDYSHMRIFEAMAEDTIEGLFLFGTNPAVGGPNTSGEKGALSKLKWMVAVDLWETETSAFWQKEAGADPASIQTEVFFLPACGSYEKEGSISNSGRWMQYRWQGIKPKGESRADLEIIHDLALKIKDLYNGSTKPEDASINALTWDFGQEGHCDIDKVCREINGYDVNTKQQIAGFGKLMDDGSTASGCWVYCGFYPEDKNLSKRRDNHDEGGMSSFLNWSFAWPMNRRVLYNRASCDLNGVPYNKEKALIHWDATQNLWVGSDVPDFTKDLAPTAENGNKPFTLNASLVGNLFAPLNEGPFPEHYEPFESPTTNKLSSIDFNPAVPPSPEAFNPKGDAKKFPIVATTYRVSEHWQTGAMTRNQPWLSELVSDMYVEISEELAKEKGIKNKDKIKVTSARGEIEAYAMVTKRFKTRTINGKATHHIGMPWAFGYKGIVKGASANTLTPHIGDANTSIPEYKAFLCDVRRA